MLGFDFEEERIKQEISKLGAKRVLIQMPEGLKPEATKIASVIEKSGVLPFISADPCYGACDLAVSEAEGLDVDLIVHFGHSKMVKQDKVPTMYVKAKSNEIIGAALLQTLPLLKGYKRIGLATSIQHLHILNQAKEFLRSAEKTVIIGDAGQMENAGQVTGCNYSNVKSIAANVEAFLFLGGGIFHALGIALSTSKPTIIADPYDNKAYTVNEEAQRILRRRFACIQEAKNAKTFGILIGSKLGQKHLDTAIRMKAIAETHGLIAFLLVGREITSEMLLEFPALDSYINTACPRISLDVSGKFQKPVLTVSEFMVVCGEDSWESLVKKGLFEN
jgi:2-(3-amino-3-carboxypropyl)histidine synthase